MSTLNIAIAGSYIKPTCNPAVDTSDNPVNADAPPDAVELIVKVSVVLLVVIVIFVPATKFKVSVVVSASIVFCPDTAIFEKAF